MNRPACYNRPPMRDGAWMPTGRAVIRRKGSRRQFAVMKPIIRWAPRWYVDRCATWDTRPNHDEPPYPITHRWDCSGCRWLPEAARPHLAQQWPEGRL